MLHLNGRVITRSEYSRSSTSLLENESHQALSDDAALKSNEANIAPISDDEDIQESEDINENIAAEIDQVEAC
ncbi:hypothetical protein N7471_006280 [Penicillium samsonianum]|uniref:uncharacterized protein n=1 Tax=Penicillium samsonianum TaxID=1882272 RepID=UPI002548CBE6|nr:uncharacterized protein N7471_006280 [Penicillium samsonianum]KAJ6139794.1 hypothetical protein N7471_006280 [Penicillium samsonianum]